MAWGTKTAHFYECTIHYFRRLQGLCWGTEKHHSWVKDDFLLGNLPAFFRCLPSSWKESPGFSVPWYLAPPMCDSGVQRLFKLDSGMHTKEQNTPCSEKCVNWMSSRKAWGSHTPEWTLEAWSAGCSLGSAGWVSVGSGGNTDTQLRGKCLHTAQLHLTNWNASAKSHWRCPRVSQMYL